MDLAPSHHWDAEKGAARPQILDAKINSINDIRKLL